MDIKAFKLVSGEDVVSQYEDQGDTYLLVEPRKILLMPSSAGLGYMYVTLSLCNPDVSSIPVSKSHVIFSTDVEPQMKKKYEQEISGYEDCDIVVPKSDLIL